MKILLAFLLLWIPVEIAFPQNRPVMKLDVARAFETEGDCKLSTIASEVRYVSLEAKPGSFIQNITRYAISDDLILVADNEAGKVMKFDRAGKYLGDFMVKGKGPKEFIHIEGLDFNSKGEILVLKNFSGIDIYSKSGDLIQTGNYYGFSTGRWLTDDRIVLAMDYLVSRGKMIVTLDRQGKELSVGLSSPVSRSENSIPVPSRISQCHEGYYYRNELFDTVFTINYKGEVYPRCILDQGPNHITKEDVMSGASEKMLNTGQKSQIISYLEYKGKILMSAIYRQHICMIEFDAITGKGFLNPKTFGIRNDIDKGPPFTSGIVLPDGSAVRIITPDELNHDIDWTFKQRGLVDPSTYDIKLYQKLADYGNPVLMIVK